MGEDARTASAERGEEAIAPLVNHLTATIKRYLMES
jgi:creatinine amidohydrolase/Fe(II)-dependent formamide hydrolase-like protein